MKTIYKTKGKAKEYGELALNIYTGCTHKCKYCYAPSVLRKDSEVFHEEAAVREGIVEATRERLVNGYIKNQEIFICFTCDPFPIGIDHTPTFDIIRLIKESGNHIAVLTKGRPEEELFSLLDENDRFGVTIACGEEMTKELEPNASTYAERIEYLKKAKSHRIPTFVSFEPVYETEAVYDLIKNADFIDEYRIGKLNYIPIDIDWKLFGETCVALCESHKRAYKIKEGLREFMDAAVL